MTWEAHMFLIPASEVAVGDLILTHGKRNRTVVRRFFEDDGLLWFWSNDEQGVEFLIGSYRPEEEVLVIGKGTTPAQTHEERNAELTQMTTEFLRWLEMDRDDDGSTDLLIAMSGAAHRLKEKLQEVYCSGNRACFPSGKREPSR